MEKDISGLKLIRSVKLGIGDVSEMTGISARQLRYWEQKGYITSVNEETNTSRKFTLGTCFKIVKIKEYLEEGFTLHKSAEKADIFRIKAEIVNKFMMETFKKIDILDSNKMYGRIDFGNIIDARKVYYRIDEKGQNFEIE